MITVEVPNSPPIRNPDEPHPIKITLTTNPRDSVPVNLTAHFDDADVGDPEFYRIASKPDWFLIETTDGFVVGSDPENAPFQLAYEVLQKVEPGSDFRVSLYANDGSGAESSRPVVLTFGVATTAIGPRTVIYPVQQKATGELKTEAGPLKVGPRLAVSHTVTFNNPTDADGFVFAESASGKLLAEKKLGTGKEATTAAHVLGQDENYTPQLPDESEEDKRTEGTDYFIIKSTGAVVVDAVTLGNNGPSMIFQLKEGSSGSITIEYHVWAYRRGPTPEELVDDDLLAALPTTKTIVRKSLTINVVTCSSPPDPIDDCL